MTMRTAIAIVALAALALSGAERLRSQAYPVVDPQVQIAAIKAANDDLIKRQKDMLQKLEELEKQAAEIKTFASRT